MNRPIRDTEDSPEMSDGFFTACGADPKLLPALAKLAKAASEQIDYLRANCQLKEAPVSNDLPCGHPASALNHPPGTIPEGQVRTVYCVACVADHREAEREVIEAARANINGEPGAWDRLHRAFETLDRLEGRQ